MDERIKMGVHADLCQTTLTPKHHSCHAKNSHIECVGEVQAIPEDSEVCNGYWGTFWMAGSMWCG